LPSSLPDEQEDNDDDSDYDDADATKIAALQTRRKCLSLLLNNRKTQRKGHHYIVLCQESPVGALRIQA
jgi:hypothetical protein